MQARRIILPSIGQESKVLLSVDEAAVALSLGRSAVYEERSLPALRLVARVAFLSWRCISMCFGDSKKRSSS
jgi:hypothetical protein